MIGPSRIVQMASAYYESCVLFAACDAGVFGKLAQLGQSDAMRLAHELRLDPRGARLLLDGCVAVGLLVKEGDLYRNTPESAAFLVPGRAWDLSGAISYNRDVFSAWGKLKELVESGRPVERPELHLGLDPQRTRTFILSMHYRALGIGRAVVPHIPVAGRKTLFDVGGGPGTYSVLLAQANPGLTCTVLDLPEVVGIADELICQQGMSERVKTLAGDYRTTPFPAGVDVIIFFGVLHQESPESIRSLFGKAFGCLNAGGQVYVMDMMTDATHTQPAFSALFAINMALTTENGWVFADAELRQWMEEAGFIEFTVRPVGPSMPHWLAAAKKPA